jgi:hypothetical protein
MKSWLLQYLELVVGSLRSRRSLALTLIAKSMPSGYELLSNGCEATINHVWKSSWTEAHTTMEQRHFSCQQQQQVGTVAASFSGLFAHFLNSLSLSL